MAYFFAGSERRGSIKEFLVEMAPPGYKALVTEIDLLRGDDQDLSDSAFQEKCFELARQSDVIFSTPPCNTHSRAPWSNHWGPVPIRNSTYPLGFPWLSSALADKANLANVLVDFSIQCMKIVKAESQSRFCIGFVEHPEHLGIVRPGDLTSIPASIWNLPELRELGFKTRAFHQIDYGAPTVKPTRILFNFGFEDMGVEGWPVLDEDHRYVGPLQTASNPAGKTLMRTSQDEEGPFKTAAAAAYPPGMCQHIAQCIWATFTAYCSRDRTGLLPRAGGNLVESPFTDIGDKTWAKSDCADNPSADPITVERPKSDTVSGEISEEPYVLEPAGLEGEFDQDASGSEFGDGAEGDVDSSNGSTFLKAGWWGAGLPIKTSISCVTRDGDAKKTCYRSMRDGGGICSPGRWPPSRRILPPQARRLMNLLDSAMDPVDQDSLAVKIVLGKISEPPLQMVAFDTRSRLEELLKTEGFHRRRPKPSSQVIDFGLLEAVARWLGDPDPQIAEMCLDGVRIGYDEKILPSPAVWPAKTRWKLDPSNPNLGNASDVNPNYPSAELHHNVLLQELRDQVEAGMMVKTTFKEARAKFGRRLKIASLAVIDEGSSFRVIHDGTNRVQVNHHIRVPDHELFPGAMDVEAAIHNDAIEGAPAPAKYLCVKSDISKAHRRVPVHEDDWGLQACSCTPPPLGGEERDQWELYLNCVGTYGVGSAAFYWGRVGALVLRIIHYVTEIRFGLRFADDYLFITAPGRTGMRTLLPIFRIFLLLAVLCIPIKWSKTSGGSKSEWIGFFFDFENLVLGLSASRAKWIQGWIDRVCGPNQEVLVVRDLEGMVGRLGFTAQVLRHVKPFLAPLYAWIAISSRSHCSKVPVAIKLVLIWIAKLVRIKHVIPMRRITTSVGEIFRTDAKAEGSTVVVGGWEVIGGELTPDSRWFSVQLSVDSAPWAFHRGQPFKTISALELFGTLLGICAFRDRLTDTRDAIVSFTGATDNQGNESVVHRGLTTKYPLCLVFMEVAAQLEDLNAELDLCWRRRDSNQEADDLTNAEFKSFNPERRVHPNISRENWLVMSWLQDEAALLYKRLDEEKAAGPPVPKRRRKGGAGLRVRDPW